VVTAYRFRLWLDGDDPDALAMEDRFFLRKKVDLSNDEEEVDDFSSQSRDSNPADHFKFVPLPISRHATDCQYSVPEYIHHYQSAKFKDIKVDASLHDAQEELMHHIKNTAILLVFSMMFTNGPHNGLTWATSLNLLKPKL
jgi:hypothetical protein